MSVNMFQVGHFNIYLKILYLTVDTICRTTFIIRNQEACIIASAMVQLPDDYLKYQSACHVQFEEFSQFRNGKSLGSLVKTLKNPILRRVIGSAKSPKSLAVYKQLLQCMATWQMQKVIVEKRGWWPKINGHFTNSLGTSMKL